MAFCGRLFSLPSLILITAIILGFYRHEVFEYLRENYDLCPKSDSLKTDTESQVIDTSEVKKEEKIDKLKYWLYGENVDVKFKRVGNVLEALGLERHNGSIKDEEPHKGWNIMWSDKTYVALNWKEVEYHQKFNHFPGTSIYLSSKRNLLLNTTSKYIPRAFNNSQDLLTYAKLHKNTKFVVKSKIHEGAKLEEPSKINFDGENFAQVYIDNPLLYHGHKFDFSVYVLITQIEPLRLYYFPKNINLRFTSKPYEELEYVGPRKEDHITAFDFEPVRDYFLNGYTLKEALNKIVNTTGGNPDDVWRQVEDCVRTITVEKERPIADHIIKIQEIAYPYFELFSFDFILDTNHNIHLMKIDPNPDLSATDKYERNFPFYENLLYNVFNLIQVGTSWKKTAFKFDTGELEMMVAHINGRTILPEFCIPECDHHCDGKCKLCTRCQTSTHMYNIVLAYREQLSSGDFKRLFPPDKEFYDAIDRDVYIEKFDFVNQLYLEWFYWMCYDKKNRHFCM